MQGRVENSTRGQHVQRAQDRKESACEPRAVHTWALGDVPAQRIALSWGAAGGLALTGDVRVCLCGVAALTSVPHI